MKTENKYFKLNCRIKQKLRINNNYDVNRKTLYRHKNNVFGAPCATQKLQIALPYLKIIVVK